MTRREFLVLIGGIMLSALREPVSAKQEGVASGTGIEFPLEFPVEFEKITQMSTTSTRLFNFRSLTFFERLFCH